MIIDVDGVLVHSIFYDEDGERYKSFNARDNRAIREMVAAGWDVILMSASSWKGTLHFATRTGCVFIPRVKNKRETLRNMHINEYYAVADDIGDQELLEDAKRAWLPRDSFRHFDFKGSGCHIRRAGAKAGEGVIADVWSDILFERDTINNGTDA